MFAVLLASITAYFATNGLAIVARVVPFMSFAVVVLLQWKTDTVWGKAQLVALLVTTIVLAFDLAGKLPSITFPAAPAKSAGPRERPKYTAPW